MGYPDGPIQYSCSPSPTARDIDCIKMDLSCWEMASPRVTPLPRGIWHPLTEGRRERGEWRGEGCQSLVPLPRDEMELKGLPGSLWGLQSPLRQLHGRAAPPSPPVHHFPPQGSISRAFPVNFLLTPTFCLKSRSKAPGSWEINLVKHSEWIKAHSTQE